MLCFFVSDLHGEISKYNKLFAQIISIKPEVVFIGGDLLSGGFLKSSLQNEDVINEVLASGFSNLKKMLGKRYPKVFIIMGNDDPRCEEKLLLKYEKKGLWKYANQKHFIINSTDVLGYCWVPPSPFLNKDWERFDVSRYVDVGCVAPEEGYHTTEVSLIETQFRTITEDLMELTEELDLSNAIMLFHAPPYKTGLDRASLDGRMVDFAPLDVHVGSIAIKRFIEERQPLVTLHGHIHESYSITGVWKEKIGNTVCLSAADNKKTLSLVIFNTDKPYEAERFEI